MTAEPKLPGAKNSRVDTGVAGAPLLLHVVPLTMAPAKGPQAAPAQVAEGATGPVQKSEASVRPSTL
mgnify:CR=1 FL=1